MHFICFGHSNTLLLVYKCFCGYTLLRLLLLETDGIIFVLVLLSLSFLLKPELWAEAKHHWSSRKR